MRKLANLIGMGLAVAAASAWSAAPADDRVVAPTPIRGQTSREADNTGINTRDRDGAMETPQNQSDESADRKLLATVRQEIVGDDSLSTAGHNVKITTRDGVVTLRGPVGTADEKGRIGKLAQEVAGVTGVENELDIDRN